MIEKIIITLEVVGFTTFVISRVLESYNERDVYYTGEGWDSTRHWTFCVDDRRRNRGIALTGFGIMFLGLLIGIWI